MSNGEDLRQSKENDFGVAPVRINEFFSDLRGRLSLIAHASAVEDLLKSSDFEGINKREFLYKPYLVIGDPGIGKTEGVKSSIEKVNKALREEGNPIQFGYKELVLGQKLVGALDGIPVAMEDEQGNIRTIRADELPDEERDGKYGVFFLDEITTADVQQMQPAMSLTDARRSIGSYKLPDGWIVVGAGNGPQWDNFMRLDTAMITRFITYNVYTTYEDWKEYAIERKVNPYILAYLDWKNEAFTNPATEEENMERRENLGTAYAVGRTWISFDLELKRMCVLKTIKEGKTKVPSDYFDVLTLEDFLAAGNKAPLGSSTVQDLVAFVKFRDSIPQEITPDAVLTGKVKTMPENTSAQVTHLLLATVTDELYRRLRQAHDGTTENLKTASDWTDADVQMFANCLNFFLSSAQMEVIVTTLVQSITKIPNLRLLFVDQRLDDASPIWTQVLADRADDLLEIISASEAI